MTYSTAFFCRGKVLWHDTHNPTNLWWRKATASEELSNQLSACAHNNTNEESHSRTSMQYVVLLVVEYVIF